MSKKTRRHVIIGSAIVVLILWASAVWYGDYQIQQTQQEEDEYPWNVTQSVDPHYGRTELYMTEMEDGTVIRLMFQRMWIEDMETAISIGVFTDTDYYFSSVANSVVEHGDPSIFSVIHDNDELFQLLPGHIRWGIENALSLLESVPDSV